MKLARPMLSALLLTLLCAIGVSPAVAAATPTGQSSQALAWFESSGLSVVRSHAGEDLSHLSANQLNELTLGTPVNAYTFTDDPGKFAPSDLWVAPVLLEDNPVATVATEFTNGESQREKLTGESRFATVLTELAADSLVVVEPDFGGRDNMGGWFLVSDDGSVTALDPVARSVLAGEVTIESFQEIRKDLLSSDGDPVATPNPVEANSSFTGGIIRAAVVVIVILLVVVGLLVWLRHDRDEPEREHKRERSPRSRGVTDDVKILERPRWRRDRDRDGSDEEWAE